MVIVMTAVMTAGQFQKQSIVNKDTFESF